jgi:hypothetical protein
VNRLYSNAITHLVSLPNASINLGTEGLDKVDSFRQKLAKVDIMLGDVQNIIEGYVRFKTQPPPERETPSQQTSDELEVEQMEEQIQQFKEFFLANAVKESENED